MMSLIGLQDAMGAATAALTRSDASLVVTLAAGQAKTVAVPEGARVVLFSATGDVWVRFGAAAAVPAADVLDGSAPELNPAAREIAGVASIGLAAPSACLANLVFYR